MPYATPAQMVSRFTEREVVALTDRAGTGMVDAQALGLALVDASAEVDAYLARRYALPLAVQGVALSSVPSILVGACCDIARYRLTGTEVMETESIRNRFRDALKLLQQIADGSLGFAEPLDLVRAGNSNSPAAVTRTNERERLFDAGTLGSY